MCRLFRYRIHYILPNSDCTIECRVIVFEVYANIGHIMFSATIRMQLTKPPWINHNGKLRLNHHRLTHSGGVIYAIDIHPSGSKVVTCGQGNQGGSGLVVVWNIQPVLDEQLSIDANCPKILSRMLHSRKSLIIIKHTSTML
jgi:hypothetical protein